VKIGRLTVHVLRAIYEIGGLLNHIAVAIIGASCVAASYWMEQPWLMLVGIFGIFIGLRRFWTASVRWGRDWKTR
jgi:hypothetical protein